MRSAKVEQILKETPLEIRIKVSCWFALNDIIHESGAREEKMWDESNPDDARMMKILNDATKELTEKIMNNINTWKSDGSPM